MKAHIGVDSQNRLIHSVVAKSASVHDSAVHGDETRGWGDSPYNCQTERIKKVAPNARDFTLNKGGLYRELTDAERLKIRRKSRVRRRVEHLFHIIIIWFGFTKVRYRGLNKNVHHLFVFVSCVLANIAMVKNALVKPKLLMTKVQCA